MFGFWPAPEPPTCPNCGSKNWKDKKDYACDDCGYVKPDRKTGEAFTLLYCDKCGCHLTEPCGKSDDGIAHSPKPSKMKL